jgi:hypothetical protein
LKLKAKSKQRFEPKTKEKEIFDMNKKSLLLGAAIAGLFTAGVTGVTTSAFAADFKCEGANACKGQGACSGKSHSCAGKNACKGKGWINVASAKECDEAKAKVAGGAGKEAPKAPAMN